VSIAVNATEDQQPTVLHAVDSMTDSTSSPWKACSSCSVVLSIVSHCWKEGIL